MRKVMLVSLLCSLLIAAVPAQGEAAGTGPASQDKEVTAGGEADGLLRVPTAPEEGVSALGATDQAAPQAAAQDFVPGAWRNLRPTESHLWDVSMLPPEYAVDCASPDQMSEGWAVGSGGAILGYCNGVWDHFIAPTEDTVWAVQAISPTLAVAVGAQGTFLTYQWKDTEQGWVWAKSPIQPHSEVLRAISIVPSDQPGVAYEGWTVGHNGAMARVTAWPSGSTPPTFNFQWETIEPILPDDNLYAVQMLSPDEGWAVGGNGGILQWDGSGWSSQRVGDASLYGVYMLSGTDGWAVGEHGVILHYGGSTWAEVGSPTSKNLIDVHMLSSNEGWAVGRDGTLLHFVDGRWSLLDDLTTDPYDYRAVDFTSGTGWAVGTDLSAGIGGVILRYDDAYENWMAVTSPTLNDLHNVYVLSDTDAWAVGAPDELGGTVLHWDGRYWQRIYQADLPIPGTALRALDMVDADEGWAMGAPLGSPLSSLILRYDGYRWAPPRFQSPINVAVNSVSMLDGNFGWAVGAGTRAILSYDNSNPPYSDQWIGVAACDGISYDLRGVSVVSGTVNDDTGENYDAWAVGQRLPAGEGGFLRRQPCAGANKWDFVQAAGGCGGSPGDYNMRAVHVLSSTLGMAVGDYKNHATAYSYADGSWGNIRCGAPGSQYRDTFVFPWGSSWYAGFRTVFNRPVALVTHRSALNHAMTIYPINGTNIYHRPLNAIHMASDTMGWAVGERGTILGYTYPNFTLQVEPAARAVRAGDTATFTVTVNSLGGIDPTVSLSVLTPTLPADATYTVSPDAISTSEAAVVSIETSPLSVMGAYYPEIVGETTVHSGDNDVPVARTVAPQLLLTDVPISSVTPSHGPADTTVTITGEGFGPDPGVGNRSTATDHVTIADVQLPDGAVTSWSETHIVVVPPDDPVLWPNGPVEGAVVVCAGGSDSDDFHTFHLEHQVTGVNPTRAVAGEQVVIEGTTFGRDPQYTQRSTEFEHVTIGGYQLADEHVKSWSNNAISITVPSAATTGPVVVTANGYDSNDDHVLTVGTYDVYLPLTLRES